MPRRLSATYPFRPLLRGDTRDKKPDYLFMEHTFTDATFEQDVLKSSVPVLVDFWAEWCGPCLVMSPIVEEVAHELDGTKIKVGKMNVDQNPTVPGQYGVMSIPTFLLFKNGQVAEQMVGTMTKEALTAKLQAHL